MTTVMAFGSFDGLHTGHMYYLHEARKLGKKLIVAIARDDGYWKPKPRYGFPEKERQKLVQSTHIADKVILGSKTDPLQRIKDQKPDIIALTQYHHVDRHLFQHMLKDMGLKTKVRMIRPYKPQVFKNVYKVPPNEKRAYV